MFRSAVPALGEQSELADPFHLPRAGGAQPGGRIPGARHADGGRHHAAAGGRRAVLGRGRVGADPGRGRLRLLSPACRACCCPITPICRPGRRSSSPAACSICCPCCFGVARRPDLAACCRASIWRPDPLKGVSCHEKSLVLQLGLALARPARHFERRVARPTRSRPSPRSRSWATWCGRSAATASTSSRWSGPTATPMCSARRRPTPRRWRRSQLFFVNGLGFEGWMERLEKSSGFKGKTIVASHGREAAHHDRGGGQRGGNRHRPACLAGPRQRQALCRQYPRRADRRRSGRQGHLRSQRRQISRAPSPRRRPR